jgi:hypothetical protein
MNYLQKKKRLEKIIKYLIYFQYIIPDNLDKYPYAIFIFHDLHNHPTSSPTRLFTKIIQEFTDIIADIDTIIFIRNNIF